MPVDARRGDRPRGRLAERARRRVSCLLSCLRGEKRDCRPEPFQALVPWKPRKFRVKEFSDLTVEFVIGPDGKVTAMKQIDPSGEYVFPRP